MKNLNTLLFTLILLFFSDFVKAQEYVPEIQLNEKNYGLYLSGQASTNGFGGTVACMLNKKLTLRGGFETLQINYGFNFDENDISYDANLDYNTGAVFLLADFYYTTRLYLSAGAGINSFNPEITGSAGSSLAYGDITIPASKIGNFKFNIEPETKISPYIGAGVRSFIGREKRITYSFETGLYYLGAPQINIEATGLLEPTANPAHGKEERLEAQINQYKFYPVVKLALGIKLF